MIRIDHASAPKADEEEDEGGDQEGGPGGTGARASKKKRKKTENKARQPPPLAILFAPWTHDWLERAREKVERILETELTKTKKERKKTYGS